MIGELRASLYDVFGYLLPGFVFLTSLSIALALLSGPQAPIQLMVLSEVPVGASFIVVSYVVGHLTHAIGNEIPPLRIRAETELLSEMGLPSELVTIARRRIAKENDADLSGVPATELVALMDEYRSVRHALGDREVFVYREGFYRGMSVASVTVALAVVLRAMAGSLCFVTEAGGLCVSRLQLVIIALLAGLASVGFYRRMRRFERYRIQRTLYAYLTTSAAAGSASH